MKELRIEIPKGYEIDVFDKNTGKVSFKKIKDKYPTTIEDLGSRVGTYCINQASSIVHIKAPNKCILNSSLYDKNIIDTKEEAEAFLALIQLRRFANAWNKIDNNPTKKYFISLKLEDGYNKNVIVVSGIGITSISSMLSFGSFAIANSFRVEFRDLLEQAKILL